VGCLLTTAIGRDDPKIFFVFACLLFVYQTMDALDGLQGRKVGMYTNATTEVFDHGFDASVLIMTTISSVVALSLTSSWLSGLLLICTLSTFYILTWENTFTNVMIFRAGFLNPTDSLLLTELMFVVSSIFPGMWTTSIRDILFLGASSWAGTYINVFLDLQLNELLTYASVYSTCYALYISAIAVHANCNTRDKSTAPTKTFLSAVVVLLPMVAGAVFVILWLVFGDGMALQIHPYLGLLTAAVPWNTSILRLIVAEISDQHIDVVTILLIQFPLILPVLAVWIPCLRGSEIIMMFVSLILSSGLYFLTLYRVVTEVCIALQMSHFWTIPSQNFKKSK